MCHDQHLHVAVVTERKMDKVMNLKSEIFTCSTWATQTFRSCLHYYWLRYGSFSRARKFLKRFLSDTLYSELAIPSAGRIFRARSLSRYWCDIGVIFRIFDCLSSSSVVRVKLTGSPEFHPWSLPCAFDEHQAFSWGNPGSFSFHAGSSAIVSSLTPPRVRCVTSTLTHPSNDHWITLSAWH